MLNLESKLTLNRETIMSSNLCSKFSQKDLDTIGQHIWDGYDKDLKSREPWYLRSSAAMDLAMQIQKDKTYPWPGCSNVIFPLVTIAALQFSARSYANIIQGSDVVRYRTMGADKDNKLRARADRISRHMSWQVLEEDQGWEEQHDRMLINLSIVGTNFIKSYYSPTRGYNVSELVMARDLVINYWAKSVNDAPRKTHVIPFDRNDIYSRVKKGTFCDCLNDTWYTQGPQVPETDPKVDNRQGMTPPSYDSATPFRMLEQHVNLDLDQDGYEEPYIVTVEESSKKTLRIVCRFDRELDIERNINDEIIKINPTEYFTKFSFIPAPDGGIYDIGFGTLIGPLNESVNTALNQLFDAGTMGTASGGFLGRGAKIRGGSTTMAPWEWKRIDSTGDDIRKSMVQLPVRDPPQVMFQLLGLLINYTDRVAGTVDTMVGENPGQNTPAETSRNTTEQGMQLYSSIFKRVWRSFKEEYKKLHRLNAIYLPMTKTFGSDDSKALAEDYKSNPDHVAPVADPNITSSGMRMMQAQLLRQAAHTVPGYNVELVEKKFLQALRIDDIDSVYPGADKVPPLPNPKMQVEQLKLEIQKGKWQHETRMKVLELMSQQKKIDAEIKLIYAQIAEIVHGIKTADSEMKLKQFETMVGGLQAHNEMISQSIEMLTKLGGEEDGNNKGSVPGMAKPPGDQGVPQVPGGMGGKSQGAVGGEAL